jgi:hypothetical protein
MNNFELSARERFGEPNKRLSTRQEMRFGTHGSVSVNLETGDYFDFEVEQGGKLSDGVADVKPAPNAPRLVVAKYDYTDEKGELLYQVQRYMPKDFRPRRPDGNGGWIEGRGCLDGVRRVPFNLVSMIASDDVVIVEGEKDAQALAALGICATWRGPSDWADISQWFADKRVWVVPDNDKAGLSKARAAVDALGTVAASIALCPITSKLPPKADVSDWLARNDPATLVTVLHSYKSRSRVMASVFSANDMRAVEPRRWLYGRHLIRGYVSATVSPGGVGKTTIELIEAVALASGCDLLGVPVRQRVRVWHYNLEDPRDELLRRVWAICEHFKLSPAELEEWLYLDSGRDCKMIVAEPVNGVVVPAVAADQVIEQMKRLDISVLQVDPLVKAHWAEENDNKQIDAVLDVFADIAKQCNAAIDLVHHTRKPPAGFVATAGDINTARGAGALAGSVRSARTITPMSDKEAEAFSIPFDRRGWFIRVDDAKGNMSAPSANAVWFERHSVELAQGDYVGVLSPWTPPDPFDELGSTKARLVLSQISQGLPDGQRYIAVNSRNTVRWAGSLLTDVGVSEGASKSILRTWLQTGLLFEDVYRNPERRKNETGLFVDATKIPTNSEVVFDA